jgi:IS1 family transposase
MNKLDAKTRILILRCLVEGNSLRATAHLADVSKVTVNKLLIDAGGACSRFHDENVIGVRARLVQCDEIWSFTYAKQKNVARTTAAPAESGDTWTWTALDSVSKLVVSYMVGGRDSEYAMAFMDDLRRRLATRVQLRTDGYKAYLEAVEEAFQADIDYAMLVKLYGEPTDRKTAERRYSPAECTGAKKVWISGEPDKALVRTSHVERQNLTMRMHMRRFTRLTNAFSKKIENHACAVALHFMYYNFARIPQTLRVSPAMAAGLTDRLWSVEDIMALVEAQEAAEAPRVRGPYKKRVPEISN